MKYQRKIFYVNEYVDGLCGKSIGYVKLFQRGNRIQIEVHVEGNCDLLSQKIYFLEKDKHAVNKLFFGTILERNSDVIMQKNTDETGEIKGEIVGVIVEGERGIVCAGTDDMEIHIADYLVAEKQQEKFAIIQKQEEIQEIIQIEMEEAHDEAYEYRKIFATRANMYPFEDDEMELCVQIAPADFSDFPKTYWQLGSNTFLLQGYYNYRHLIFAQAKEHLYVGIPGQYHRRDKYLADMFGFQRFKGIHKSPSKLGDFGYWLMAIPKPQPTECWVDCGKMDSRHQEME